MFHPTLDPQLVGEVIAARRKKKRKPTLETLYRIACALDVPMSALVLDMEAEMVRRQG